MISINDVVLPCTDKTSCYETAKMINPDIDFYQKILIHKQSAENNKYSKTLQMDDLKQIKELLLQHNRLVIMIGMEPAFGHTFTLLNTIEGIYIVDSYIGQQTLEKRSFNLDKFLKMLISISKYVISEYTDENYNECTKIWYDFWDKLPIGGRKDIRCFTIKYCHKIKDITFYKCSKCRRINMNGQESFIGICYNCMITDVQIKEDRVDESIDQESKKNVANGISGLLLKANSTNNPEQKSQNIVKIYQFINQNNLIVNTASFDKFRTILVNKLLDLVIEHPKLFTKHTSVFNETLKYIQYWDDWDIDYLNSLC